MENFQFEQFFAGLIVGIAIRSTDILPVAVGGIIGYYISNKKIDILETLKNLTGKYMPDMSKSSKKAK